MSLTKLKPEHISLKKKKLLQNSKANQLINLQTVEMTKGEKVNLNIKEGLCTIGVLEILQVYKCIDHCGQGRRGMIDLLCVKRGIFNWKPRLMENISHTKKKKKIKK